VGGGGEREDKHDEDDEESVSRALVSINGIRVVDRDDFGEKVAVIDLPLTLAASNQIAVEVKGNQGGTITVLILGFETTGPTITGTATPPPNANGWNNTDVTVSFTCSDATSGVATCSSPQTATTEGANQSIQGSVVDNAGNTATVSVTLNIDKTPPISLKPCLHHFRIRQAGTTPM
jgi:large repetitive protein